MAILTVYPAAGTTPADCSLVAAAGGGDSFPNTGKEVFLIKNAGAGGVTLTFKGGATPCEFGKSTTAHDEAVTVPNDSKTYAYGPFPTRKHNDANGRVQVTYSGVASVTVGVIAAPPSA